MKAVLQRVARAEVRVGDEPVARIGTGLVVLLGVLEHDGEAEADRLAAKVVGFRCFPPAGTPAGRMERSLLEVGGACLVVSQVTLAADGRKGRRPSLDGAAPAERAEALYLRFAARCAALGAAVATGRFGAAMEVELVNVGPVTFVLEEHPRDAAAGGAGSSQVLA